jgi:hypothetical protein
MNKLILILAINLISVFAFANEKNYLCVVGASKSTNFTVLETAYFKYFVKSDFTGEFAKGEMTEEQKKNLNIEVEATIFDNISGKGYTFIYTKADFSLLQADCNLL